jgi:hypothetical protein
MHDSTMAQYGVYCKLLQELFKDYGAVVVVDSAFSHKYYPFLIKSSQEDPAGELEAVLAHRDATMIPQLSEWGMRGGFPLKVFFFLNVSNVSIACAIPHHIGNSLKY